MTSISYYEPCHVCTCNTLLCVTIQFVVCDYCGVVSLFIDLSQSHTTPSAAISLIPSLGLPPLPTTLPPSPPPPKPEVPSTVDLSLLPDDTLGEDIWRLHETHYQPSYNNFSPLPPPPPLISHPPFPPPPPPPPPNSILLILLSLLLLLLLLLPLLLLLLLLFLLLLLLPFYRLLSSSCPAHSFEAGIPVVWSWATAWGTLLHPEGHRKRAEGKSGGQQARDAGGMAEGSGRWAHQRLPCDSTEEHLIQDGWSDLTCELSCC